MIDFYDFTTGQAYTFRPINYLSLNAYYTRDYKDIGYSDNFPYLQHVYARIIHNIFCDLPQTDIMDNCVYFIEFTNCFEDFIKSISDESRLFIINQILLRKYKNNGEHKLEEHINLFFKFLLNKKVD